MKFQMFDKWKLQPIKSWHCSMFCKNTRVFHQSWCFVQKIKDFLWQTKNECNWICLFAVNCRAVFIVYEHKTCNFHKQLWFCFQTITQITQGQQKPLHFFQKCLKLNFKVLSIFEFLFVFGRTEFFSPKKFPLQRFFWKSPEGFFGCLLNCTIFWISVHQTWLNERVWFCLGFLFCLFSKFFLFAKPKLWSVTTWGHLK